MTIQHVVGVIVGALVLGVLLLSLPPFWTYIAIVSVLAWRFTVVDVGREERAMHREIKEWMNG